MWIRVTQDGEAKYRLIHLETGNRIDVISNNGYHTLSMYVKHGSLPTGRPDIEVHDLAKGSQAACEVTFERICNSLLAAGQLVQ